MTRALKRFLVSLSLAPQVTHAQSKSTTVLLPREETHHLKNVLRMKEGELCLLFDSSGYEFVSRIERFLADDRSEVSLLDPVLPNSQSSSLKLTVAQAIPQDRKMDEIVRQAAELGVYEITPLITERTIVRITKDKSPKVIQRWQRIADQTLKQSRLNRAPKILQPMTLDALAQNFNSYKRVFILDTSSSAVPIKDYVSTKIESALLIIGPEGGFSEDEVKKAERLGAKRISLGEGILKTDTAFVAAVSFFRLISS